MVIKFKCLTAQACQELLAGADAETQTQSISQSQLSPVMQLEVILYADIDAIPSRERSHASAPSIFGPAIRHYEAPASDNGKDLHSMNIQLWYQCWRKAFKHPPATLELITFDMTHRMFSMGPMETVRMVQEYA